ncbi:OLC1v1013921C1 [Oldenlandia corymbosa var. corymbosa]|uniref:OLC1v1013921C1 n=1 Tax=Oldenlandia corymbosa var. corymbosa TaxID=529605 RepID=A0AAV1E2W5_OLDCO|nr:OLC1v1013921C1 [Oldenlandia corymbosa var. corymbosa]
MSSSSTSTMIPTVVIIFLSLIFTTFATKQSSLYPFESIYQFGDSLSDTGNRIRQVGAKSVYNISNLPYGMTYFHKPTGRFSNGLLVVDFVAKALNLPLLPPYLEKNVSFSHGVNFAVAGSTALDNAFFLERNIIVPSTNIPLSHQITWFKEHLNSVSDDANAPERKEMLKKALVIIGGYGGNDVNNAISHGWSLEEIRKDFVSFIVESISNAVREAIHLGAAYIVVPGNLPEGCLPIMLTQFPSADVRDYDEQGCLRKYNEFVLFFNSHLQKAVESLKIEFPDAVILYFDYYQAFQSILHYGDFFGFDQNSKLKACCGVGGKHNYNEEHVCGSKGVEACQNPAEFIHWDGIHLTQAAYSHISDRLIHDVLPKVTSATLFEL